MVLHINTDLNKDLANTEDGHLGPTVNLIRTYTKVVERDMVGNPKIIITIENEEVSLPALVAVGFPNYGLSDDCEVKRSRVEFGSVLDQWGQSL